MLKDRADDKLYIYLPSFAGGGAERVFVRIANELQRKGEPVSFVVNQAVGPMRALLSPDVPVIALGAPRTRNAVLPMTRLLSRTRPAAILSALTFCNATALVANRLAGARPAS